MPKYLKALHLAASAAIVLTIILLAWQCLDIYAAGRSPSAPDDSRLYIQPMYTREDVASRLESLFIPFTACAAVIAAAAIAQLISGYQTREHHSQSPEHRLCLMKARLTELPPAARKKERMRRMLTYTAVLCTLCWVVFCLLLLLNAQTFPAWETVSPDTAVKEVLLYLLPPTACVFLMWVSVSFGCKASIEQELLILHPETAQAASAPAPSRQFSPAPVRIMLYALAILFIVLGVMNGGLKDLFYKAINICTECIGLG